MLWLTSLTPSIRPLACTCSHAVSRMRNVPDPLPLPIPEMEDRMLASFYWELRELAKAPTTADSFDAILADPTTGNIALEESSYCCDVGENATSRSGNYDTLRRRAIFWLKRSVRKVIHEMIAVHDMSGFYSETVAKWLLNV